MATISQLAVGLALHAKDFHDGITEAVERVQEIGQQSLNAAKGVVGLGDAAEQTEGRLSGLATQAKRTVAAFLGFATTAGAIGFGVKLAADAEQTETAFATMLRSADKAAKMMADIRDFEAETPLNLTELENSARSLIAFQTSQEQVIPTLRVLGDIASGVQMPLNELAQIYGKARVQGRLFMEDINQLTGRGIPVIGELAKQFGVAESEVRKLVAEGKVGFPDIQRAFQSLTSEGGIFAGAMEAQSKKLAGVFSTLKSAVESVFRSFGTSFAESAGLTDAVTDLTDGVKAFESIARLAGTVLGTMASWILQLGKWIVPVIAFFKIFTFVVGTLFNVMTWLVAINIVRWAAGFIGLRLGVLAVQGAMLLLRGAYLIATIAVTVFQAMTGPQGWAIIAAGAAIAAAAVYGITEAYNSATEAAKERQKAEQEAFRIEEQATAAADAAAAAEARRVELLKRRAAAIQAVSDAVAKTRFDVRTAGMSQAEKELERMKDAMRQINRETGRRANYADGTTFEQQSEIFKLKAAERELAIVEQQAKLRDEMLKAQKEAAQVGLTSGQKMLDDLRRSGATWQQMYAAQRAAQQLDAAERAKEQAKQQMKQQEDLRKQGARMQESLATPLEKYKQELARIVKIREAGGFGNETAARALEAANKSYLQELRDSSSSRAVESPTALLAGTAEAALANDRLRTPMETMADLQRRQLAESRKQTDIARQQLDQLRNHPVQEVNIPG